MSGRRSGFSGGGWGVVCVCHAVMNITYLVICQVCSCFVPLVGAGMDGITGGPAPFAKADRSRFLQALDKALVGVIGGLFILFPRNFTQFATLHSRELPC